MSNLVIELLKILLIWFKSILVYLFVPNSFLFKSIEDEIVLITGGGSGIGRIMAVLFASKGAKIVIWDLAEDGMKRTAQMVQNKGGKCYSYKVDVSDRNEVYSAAERVKRDVGKVNILVNNAGIVNGKRLEDLPDEKIIKTMEGEAVCHLTRDDNFLFVVLHSRFLQSIVWPIFGL